LILFLLITGLLLLQADGEQGRIFYNFGCRQLIFMASPLRRSIYLYLVVQLLVKAGSSLHSFFVFA